MMPKYIESAFEKIEKEVAELRAYVEFLENKLDKLEGEKVHKIDDTQLAPTHTEPKG